ncbi:MFS transporter [Saccharothrix texasensis]|uniref:Putative MFS family arabinose efflux permease n=1 Tax=Saccharothrix texasensis TaxID=103734 RepID=A0A3N1GZ50_9PSEU|nr:MFS transporter [Saccharothrix texasensis]ROP35585.1 putative MFS family arabinose efflux permease [Saccharothrix texasensis]
MSAEPRERDTATQDLVLDADPPAVSSGPDPVPPAAAESASEEQAPERPLIKNRDFQALWSSEAFAAVAKETAEIAYPLLILATTGSALYAGVVGSAQLITASVMSIPGGTLADRVDRRLLLAGCNLVRVLLLALFSVLIFTENTNMPIIFAIAVTSAVCFGLSQPAGMAAIKALVPPSQLTQATAQNQIRYFGATVAGPPIGGALFAVARAFPYLAAALSFLISTALLLLVRKPMQSEESRAAKEKGGTAEGFRFLFKQPILRPLIIWIMGSNMAFTHSGVFLALIATAQGRGASESFIGATLAVAGLGGLFGSLIAGWVFRKFKPSTIVLYGAWIGPVVAILLAITPGVVPLGIIVTLVFIRGPIISTLFLSYLAAVAPDKVQGRVLGAVFFMSMSAAPIGVFLVGLVFDLAGSTWVFITMCVISGVAALPTLTKRIRTLPAPETVAV